MNRFFSMLRLLGFLPVALCAALLCASASVPAAFAQRPPVVVDDFEGYQDGVRPDRWKYITNFRSANPLGQHLKEEREDIRIASEQGNQFVRAWTRDESVRFTQRAGNGFDWAPREHPYLQWRWRVNDMPEGAASEDVGAAVLVTFGSDWIGRPKNLKYAYSTTLPVGTIKKNGLTRTLVIASGRSSDPEEWSTVTRDVVSDIKNVFGEKPPYDGLAITLWSDSDEVHDTSEADFDDIRLLADPSQ